LTLSEFAVLADENIHPKVVEYLQGRGLDVARVQEFNIATDVNILRFANETGRVVLTHDGDFGLLAVRGGEPVLGIVYLRPGHIRPEFTIATLQTLLDAAPELTPPFMLVAGRTGDKVRIRVRSL
jgi:predicted nuclease of predicted toxin-antitoxin system